MIRIHWMPIEGVFNYFINRRGDVLSLRNKTPKLLSTKESSDGYIRISLRTKIGRAKCFYLHRLVAKAFIPTIAGRSDVNHKDGDKSNNNCYNLEWVTKSENSQHAADNGLMNYDNAPKGENHRDHKLTEADVKYIREELIPNQHGIREIARKYGVCHKSIMKIRDYITWKHI